jgi:hypothetical protein
VATATAAVKTGGANKTAAQGNYCGLLGQRFYSQPLRAECGQVYGTCQYAGCAQKLIYGIQAPLLAGHVSQSLTKQGHKGDGDVQASHG